jgi:predicted Zn-dependent peptidase
VHENRGEKGVAHFLEHALMVSESKKYNIKESDKIKETFASFNAYTSLEKTVFLGNMLEEDSPLFIKYLPEMVYNPRFNKKRIEEERIRILRETADSKSNPFFVYEKIYADAFFGKNSPHTYSILGDEDVIESVTIDTLKKFHKRGYYPNNTDLILVGGLPKNIEQLIWQNFSSFKKGKCEKFKFPKNPQLKGPIILHTKGPELYNHENPKQSSAKLNLGLVAPTKKEEDNYAVNMLVNILGGGSNSALFTNMSQRKGLAYKVAAQYDDSNNKGGIHIGASVNSQRINEAIDTIFEEMTNLRSKLISQEILNQLKKNYRYFFAKTFETNSGRIDVIELKIDSGLTPKQYIDGFEKITPEHIRDVAIKYLPKNRSEGKYVLSLRDPFKE